MKKIVLGTLSLAALAAVTAPAWAGEMCRMGGMMMNCPMPPSSTSACGKIAPLLVALAAGYAVLTVASKQTRKLSLLGTIIGWFILVVSVSGLLCVAAKGLCGRCPDKSSACPFMSGKTACVAPADAEPSPDEKPVEKAPAKAPVKK